MHARYLACATLNIEECEKGPPMAGLFVLEPGSSRRASSCAATTFGAQNVPETVCVDPPDVYVTE